MSKGRVLVVGAGINGLCTAWGLVRRGFAVEVFEQGPVPNPKASSHDEHRITRHAYGEMHRYARLMPEAFALYEQLWRDIGARHIAPMPSIVLEREPTPWIEASIVDLEAMGIAWRELPLGSLPAQYPMINMDGLTRAVEFGGAGMLFPVRILTDLVVHLAARGVAFHAGAKVDEIDPEAGTLTVGGRVHAGDHVVVAAGAWADRLVPEIRGVAVPSRQAVIFLAPPTDLAAAWAAAPIFLDLGLESGTYTLPPRPGTRLKVGDHTFTRSGDADGDRAATDADVARLLDAADKAYAGFGRYTILERKACFYTVTEDERFLAEPIGARGTVLSACSGHGFKLAPLMGDKIAEGIATGVAYDHSGATGPTLAAARPVPHPGRGGMSDR
jgi:glycine/D-amino acid oxidase-like deaminating enzyme